MIGSVFGSSVSTILMGLFFLTGFLVVFKGMDDFCDVLASRVISPSIDLFGFIIYNYSIWQ